MEGQCSAFTETPGAVALRSGETAREQRWGNLRDLPRQSGGGGERGGLPNCLRTKRDREIFWTDRSRLDSQDVGVAVVWWEGVHPFPPSGPATMEASEYARAAPSRASITRHAGRQAGRATPSTWDEIRRSSTPRSMQSIGPWGSSTNKNRRASPVSSS